MSRKSLAILLAGLFAFACLIIISNKTKEKEIPVINDLSQLRFGQVKEPKNSRAGYNFSLKDGTVYIRPQILEEGNLETLFGNNFPGVLDARFKGEIRITGEGHLDELFLSWYGSDPYNQEKYIMLYISENSVPEYLQNLSYHGKSIYDSIEISAYTCLNKDKYRCNFVDFVHNSYHYLLISGNYETKEIIPYIDFFITYPLKTESFSYQ